MSARLADRLDGLLFFPVTAFAADGRLDLDAYRAHVRERLAQGAAAVSPPAAPGSSGPSTRPSTATW